MPSITVPSEYGYVILTVTGTFFLSQWHGGRISSFRKPAGMAYPKAYADSADMANATPEKKHAMYLFNCAQRAHGNYLENQPSVALALLVAGLQYPIASSVMGVGWMVNRVIYAIGYTRSDRTDGKGRLVGSGHWLFQLGIWLLMGYQGVQMARGKA